MDETVHYRLATVADMPGIRSVRYSVRENMLSYELPSERVREALTTRGRGWVAEVDATIVGFSMADVPEGLIWALFVLPEWEGRGLGKTLLGMATEWLWSLGVDRVTLTTGPGTRADEFYSRRGWRRCGMTKRGEVEYEIVDPRA